MISDSGHTPGLPSQQKPGSQPAPKAPGEAPIVLPTLARLDAKASQYIDDLVIDNPYGQWLFRRKPDGLYQFGIYKTGVEQYLPKMNNNIGGPITSAVCVGKGGYLVEAKIPLASYLEDDLEEYRRIGFTIVVSDTDSSSNLQNLLHNRQ